MRIIKFRAKTPDGVWFKWSLLDPIDIKELAIDPNTVGQWTGLLDNSGKEIYEGDIVKTELRWGTPKECLSQIFFEYGEFFGQSIVEHDIVGKGDRYIRVTLAEEHHICEVIGNIYKNPNLLN